MPYPATFRQPLRTSAPLGRRHSNRCGIDLDQVAAGGDSVEQTDHIVA